MHTHKFVLVHNDTHISPVPSRTKRGHFFDTMRIAPPHRCDFMIDLQQCWSINRKIGDRQCTYYLIVRALTVADCCFLVAATIWTQHHS